MQFFKFILLFILNLLGVLSILAQEDSVLVRQLDEVEVKTQRNISSALAGREERGFSWDMHSLQAMPQFLGFADPVKYMQLLPGIQTTGELSSGLFMQGCETSHNQISLGGVPIYNAMHLLGFFSIFNTGHMQNFDLQKSALSSEYGNRIGGALQMYVQDSVKRKFSITGNVGIIASQATLTIPIDSSSTLYLSGRGSYINLLYKGMLKVDNSELSYDFQDYNLTYTKQITGKDRLIANFYYGSDRLKLKEELYQADGKIGWNNLLSSINWKRKQSDYMFFDQMVYLSRYENKVSLFQNNVNVLLPSRIADWGYKGKLSLQKKKIQTALGAEYIYHLINPQSPVVEGSYNQTNQPSSLQRAHEISLFISARYRITPVWEIEAGIRGISFLHSGLLAKEFFAVDPRFTSIFEIGTGSKFIFHYGSYHQYMNQICTSGLGLPTDFWVAASKDIPAQRSHNFSLGYFRSFLQDRFSFSIEGYYKRLYHQSEYNNSLFDMINRHYILTEMLVFGNGDNYGVDFMLKKNYGKFTGWISYTLGWADRKFPNFNGGNKFPSIHDRRHDFSFVLECKLSKRFTVNGLFVYASGTPYTAPAYAYMIGENIISEYEPHNSSRIPDYHRLDLSFNYWFCKSLLKESGLNISVYNLYNRRNPFFIDLQVKDFSFSRRERSLYGIIPSISYFFKF